MAKVRPTKKKLKEIVTSTRAARLKEVNTRKMAADEEFMKAFWESFDPEFKNLKAWWEASTERIKARNAVIEKVTQPMMEKLDGLYIYRLTYPSDTFSWQQFYKNTFGSIPRRCVPKYEEMIAPFEEEERNIRDNYAGVLVNIDSMTPKKGLEYLKEMDFDVSEFEKEEVLPPLVIVDKAVLGTPIKEEK